MPVLDRLFKRFKRRVLFLGQTRGDTFRYRCKHQAEQLRSVGMEADAVLLPGTLPRPMVDYDAIVLHRLVVTKDLREPLTTAREAGKALLFDADDLVFAPEFLNYFRPLGGVSKAALNQYRWRVAELAKTAAFSTGGLVPTQPLQEALQRVVPGLPVWVNRNAVGEVMVSDAEEALAQHAQAEERGIRLGYFSGSKTHQEDFDVCVAAVRGLLEHDERVRLLLVGDIALPEELAAFSSRIEVHEKVSWRELPHLIRKADINLAPLEAANPFTECKSELKYFEAGLVAVPTAASEVGGFREAIENGTNGFLCQGPAEWREALDQLVRDSEFRRDMGRRAREDVLARYTSEARGPELKQVIEEAIDRGSPAAHAAWPETSQD